TCRARAGTTDRRGAGPARRFARLDGAARGVRETRQGARARGPSGGRWRHAIRDAGGPGRPGTGQRGVVSRARRCVPDARLRRRRPRGDVETRSRRAGPGRCAARSLFLLAERRSARTEQTAGARHSGRAVGIRVPLVGGRLRDARAGQPPRSAAQARRRSGKARHPNGRGNHTMRLTRLELAGFKSFAGAVELPFETGVTAIVGPNGCGKSNISDAVRWVLGEQSPRLLRGGKMEDVIFQGSTGRRPVNVAEVSLVFDNTDGTLPIAYQEVLVTRRLSRSGQSEYLLNRSPVRLRDIQDLLRGTGLGADAAVVMEARMIEALLSERAEERRAMFEEAAGIGLYRDRKTSTERRLEETAADLARLEDLVSEVQTQVRSLARQRGKAERYVKMIEERFGIALTLVRAELEDFDLALGGLGQRAEQLAAALPAERTKQADAEQAREAEVQARHTAEARRTDVERRLNEARLEVGRLEGDLALAAERLRNAGQRRTTAGRRREQEAERALQTERERAAAEAECAAAEGDLGSVGQELAGRTALEQEVRDRQVAERKERETRGRATRGQTEEALAQVAARRDALAELERQRVGLAPAAQALLKEKAQFGDAVIGPLSDFVRTGRRDAELAEQLLGEWLHAVLVRDAAAVDAVRRWHDQAQPGPLVLLPSVPGPALAADGHPLQEGLRVDGPAAAWVHALLAGHEVLDGEGRGSRALRRANGAVFLAGRAAAGRAKGGGPLQRRADLDALAQEVADAEAARGASAAA